jgi:DNA-binding transcriptional regulator LsrR (DeoR family)
VSIPVRSPIEMGADASELLVTAAVLYYEQDRSQEQIARELGVSRSTVSRLLSQARREGIVRIEIVPPRGDAELAERLRHGLGLREVRIAAGRADPAAPGPILANAVDEMLTATALGEGDALVVSWGRAVHSVGLCRLTPRPGVLVAPAIGGTSMDATWFQPNEIARQWAATLGGTPRYLHAPAVVSRALKRSLLADTTIEASLELWHRARVVLVGIGTWPKRDPSLMPASLPTDDPAFDVAVGDVVARLYGEDGSLVPYRDESQLLAITPDRLREIPWVVGIGAGEEKITAIIGAARARLIGSLVTDSVTARAVAERL